MDVTGIVSTGRGIVTPQGVILDLQAAGVGSRGMARVIDLMVSIVVLGAVSGIGNLIGGTGGLVFQLLFGFGVIFGYPLISETWFRGRTLGKWVLGLRVVTLEAGPIGFREAMIRSLFQLLDILMSLGTVALICGMLTNRSQRLGDVAAGTFVIEDPRTTRHIPPIPFTPPMGTEDLVADLDVSRLTPAQERVIRSFLLRVGDLSADARVALAANLAARTGEALGHDRRPFINDEVYLVAVMAARQLREGGLAQLAIDSPTTT